MSDCGEARQGLFRRLKGRLVCPGQGARTAREKKTIEAMIGLYCRSRHGSEPGPCPECADLLCYAMLRLEKCPYQGDKPVCTDCPIHCYKPEMRERIRSVMRYSGPRLILRHPVLALLHLVDARRKVPAVKN